MGSQFASVKLGGRESAEITRWRENGKVDILFTARTSTGVHQFRAREVAWNSIYVPPALQDEIQQCRVLVWAFSRLIPLTIPQLLPLDNLARRAHILAALAGRGLCTRESIHAEILRSARGRDDLSKAFVIDAVLVFEPRSSAPRRVRSALAASKSYLLAQVPLLH